MLSVEKCRELLPRAGHALTDEEIADVRDRITVIATAALDLAVESTRPAPLALETIPPETREKLEERAAIMELDGKLPRDRAERAAFAQVLGIRSR